MATLNAYVNFDGNCEEAFKFYQSVFGGEFSYFSRFGEMPPMEGVPPVAEADAQKVMHVSLPISAETILMGSDTMAGCGPAMVVGNNFSLSVSTETKEEADRYFQALAEGGAVTCPIEDAFWGDYFGCCEDKFGINWMVMSPQKR